MIINVYPSAHGTHTPLQWPSLEPQIWTSFPCRNHLEHTISGIPPDRRLTQTGLPTTTTT
jgi:hypothetical protein